MQQLFQVYKFRQWLLQGIYTLRKSQNKQNHHYSKNQNSLKTHMVETLIADFQKQGKIETGKMINDFLLSFPRNNIFSGSKEHAAVHWLGKASNTGCVDTESHAVSFNDLL